MQFTTTVLSLLTAAAISSAAPTAAPTAATSCPVVQTGDNVWKISEFYSRKLDGKTISSLGFNIKATNGGTLDFTCSAQADSIEAGKYYSCGENSFLSFAYTTDPKAGNGILLKQTVSDAVTLVGSTVVPEYCRAGGSGPNDFVCNGVSDTYIALVQLPQEA